MKPQPHNPLAVLRQSLRRGGRRLLLAALLLAAPVAVARADDLKINGLWYNDVQVLDITAGKIYYNTRTGEERSNDLASLGGMKLTTYPEVEQFFTAIEGKDDKAALAAVSKLQTKAREKWLQHWALAYKAIMLDRTGDPVRAVQAYLQAVEQKVDPALLAAAPMQSLPQASDGQKRDLADRLEKALKRADGVAATNIKKMLELVQVAAPEAAAPATAGSAAAAGGETAAATPGNASEPTTTPSAAPAMLANLAGVGAPQVGEALQSVVPISRQVDPRDPINLAIAAGKFDEANTQVDRMLAGKTQKLSENMYQKGLVLMYQAQAKGNDPRQLKDAALMFMRVAIYFSRSAFAGPALLEAGYIHQQLGMDDEALKLLDKAENMLDEELEPELWQRLHKLKAG